MKLRHVDFKNLIYPIRDDDGVKSELVLVGILTPGAGVYSGIPIMYCACIYKEVR
jgi:hypothetical protein